jgi:lipopolysaccharide transport system ATP-binding protein
MTGSIEVDHVGKRFVLNGEAGMDLREKFSPRFRRSAQALPREEFWALEDVSFRVLPGETLGIVGHNGSGKSTLLKILTGILQPTRGKVRVHGRIGALIEVGAGFHPDLTGRENVFLNGSLLGLKRAEIVRKFDSIVRFAELERFMDTPVKRYSSGMYMRLGFAISAHIDPDILMVDEVLAVGDMAFQVKCMDRVRQMSAAGTTIVFVSHSMDAVAKVCRQAILLDQGRVVAQGATDMVVNAYQRQMMDQIAIGYRDAEEEASPEPEAPEESAPAVPPLRIAHVELYDARNQICRNFHTGEPLTIRIAYEADRPIRDAVIGWTASSATGPTPRSIRSPWTWRPVRAPSR